MELEDLALEIRELRERLDDWPTDTRRTDGPFPNVRIEKEPPKQNYKLKPKKLPIYRGDRSTYGAWRRAVLSTLKADWNTFQYDNPSVFLMIYNALEGRAQKEAASFFESGGPNGRQNPEDFIGFLDRSNWDVNKVNRARSELNSMKMGVRQRWSSFFPQWANKLTESHGDQWPDDVKISLLKGTLNHTLRVALANNHLLPSSDYFEWLRIVGQIAQQHDELAGNSDTYAKLEMRGNNHDRNQKKEGYRDSTAASSFKEPGKSGTERGYVGEFDSSGDAFMGGG